MSDAKLLYHFAFFVTFSPVISNFQPVLKELLQYFIWKIKLSVWKLTEESTVENVCKAKGLMGISWHSGPNLCKLNYNTQGTLWTAQWAFLGTVILTCADWMNYDTHDTLWTAQWAFLGTVILTCANWTMICRELYEQLNRYFLVQWSQLVQTELWDKGHSMNSSMGISWYSYPNLCKLNYDIDTQGTFWTGMCC